MIGNVCGSLRSELCECSWRYLRPSLICLLGEGLDILQNQFHYYYLRPTLPYTHYSLLHSLGGQIVACCYNGCCFANKMIEWIDQIQISISERLDHLTTLLLDGQQLSSIVKDQQRKRVLVKNFRIIKVAEKARVAAEARCLKQLQRARQLTKGEIIACESMVANCVNQYLNTDYQARKSGDILDLLDIFLFYYKHINAQAKIAQLTILRNCALATELPFLQENLAFLLGNVRASMNHVYQREKEKFLALSKYEPKSISPQRKQEDEQQRFDATGRLAPRDKKKLQQYCFELSRLLDLQSIYVNYFYFNSLDTQKRKRALSTNYAKRNLHVRRLISAYESQFRAYRDRQASKQHHR